MALALKVIVLVGECFMFGLLWILCFWRAWLLFAGQGGVDGMKE